MVLHFLQPAHFITFEQWFSSSDDRQSIHLISRHAQQWFSSSDDRQSQFIWSPDMLSSGFHHQMTEPIHLISRHAQQWFSSSDDRANSSDLQTCSTVVFIIRWQTEPIHLISRQAQQWFSSSDDTEPIPLISRQAQQWFSSSDDRQSQFIWSPDMLNSGFHHQMTEPIHLISRHAQQWFSSSDDRANSSDLQTCSAVVFIIRWQNQFIWSPDMLNSGFHHQMTVTAPGVHPTCNFCLHPTFFFWPWQVDVLKCVVRRDNKHNFYCILSQIRGQNHENWLWMQVKSYIKSTPHLWKSYLHHRKEDEKHIYTLSMTWDTKFGWAP